MPSSSIVIVKHFDVLPPPHPTPTPTTLFIKKMLKFGCLRNPFHHQLPPKMGLVRTVHTQGKAGSKERDSVEGGGETTQLRAELHELAIALPFPSIHCGP